MFKTQTLALPAEPQQAEFTRRVWKDRTLVKTHVFAWALGIATVLYVQHYAPDPQASAATRTTPTSLTAAVTAHGSAEGK